MAWPGYVHEFAMGCRDEPGNDKMCEESIGDSIRTTMP